MSHTFDIVIVGSGAGGGTIARELAPTGAKILIVERGGKDISGTTMDPNVTGRFWVPGLPDADRPRVATIVLLDLTEVSAGNALGIGFADFIPVALAERIDWQKTYVNCFTAGIAGVRRARMPMVLPDEEACIKAALSMCGRGFDEPKRVLRVDSTLHATEALLVRARTAFRRQYESTEQPGGAP